jgi:hypothetical protein
MKRVALILALSTSVSFAQVADVKKGEPAPFTGVLFSPEASQDLKKRVETGEIDSEKVRLLNEQNKILQERVDLWMKQSDALSKRVVEMQDDSFWKKSAYFGLGAVVTVVMAFAVKGAVR